MLNDNDETPFPIDSELLGKCIDELNHQNRGRDIITIESVIYKTTLTQKQTIAA
ncbi:hypothetical protein [Dysgonomonas sp. 521]|uniref:hypothetical protein n=1 Tax=Dysgonomonas sp. 521 TaxID=2302932 RepID=UPI0013D6324C|nr:hypothetical protein [Dysgonomonas sp. 521]